VSSSSGPLIRLACALLLLAVSRTVSAGDPALVLGDGLVESGDCDAAITEYKRFLCFHSEDDSASEVYLRIGRAYFALDDSRNAIDSLQRSVEAAVDDATRDERRISAGVLLLAMGDYSAAESGLLRVRTFSSDQQLQRKAVFFLAVCYVYRFEWDDARKELDCYFGGKSSPTIDRLRSLLSTAGRPRCKSERVARTLSTVIPGAGQAYAGDYRGALNALCVNAVFGIPFARSLLDRRLFEASTVFPFFDRYYEGNRANGAKAAREHNDRLSRRHAKLVLDALLKAAAEAPQ